MLPDALRFDRYGSLEDIEFLLEHALSDTEVRTMDDLSRFCEEKSMVLASSLDATLALLEYVSMVSMDTNGNFRQLLGISHMEIANAIMNGIFTHLMAEAQLSNFILPEAIEYDSVSDTICIRNNLIPLEYSGLKNLLISLHFFKPHPFFGNLLQVAKEIEPLFETTLIPGIKEERFPQANLKGLSLAALIRIQELNELHGREAEEFVLWYERQRLGIDIAAKVRIISDLQCDAGYDIASFEAPSSVRADRFIEVKSYSGEPSFFWSCNEVSVAELKKNEYFLYLVNRTVMLQEGYEPIIIQNPYESVFLDTKLWNRDAQSWYFKSSV